MVWADNGAFVGLVSSGMSQYTETGQYLVYQQIFTYVPFYYEWIEQITGLEMPKVNGPQAPIYADEKFVVPEGVNIFDFMA